MFSPIQQARYIDVSIREFQKTCLCKFSACVMFLNVSCTILWRFQLRSPQNGNLKKSIIHLSRNVIHMTNTTFIFLKVFWTETKTLMWGTKTVLIWMNQRVLLNVRVNYCALRCIAWKERVRAHVIRSKQGHIVRYVQFNIQGLWIVFPYCLAGTKTSEEL